MQAGAIFSSLHRFQTDGPGLREAVRTPQGADKNGIDDSPVGLRFECPLPSRNRRRVLPELRPVIGDVNPGHPFVRISCGPGTPKLPLRALGCLG